MTPKFKSTLGVKIMTKNPFITSLRDKRNLKWGTRVSLENLDS